MSAKPQARAMSSSNDGKTIGGTYRDIIECALQNDLCGVEAALTQDSRLINAQRAGSGITPLMAASGRGLNRMVLHLLSKEGVDVRLVDEFGKNAFDHGRIFPEIVSALVRHEHPSLKWKEPELYAV